MSEQKDLIIAAASGYSWDKIDVWALSLAKSGYQGLAAVILYDGHPTNADVEAKLKSLGIQVITMPLNGSVFNQRFLDIAEVIYSNRDNLRYVVVTDIRDVYFQADPTVWLEKNLVKDAMVVSECIPYEHEAWNRDNLLKGFPHLAARILPKTVYNVGVIAGRPKAVSDLCIAVTQIARSTNFPVADQSGLNVLLDMEPYASAIQMAKAQDGFVTHAGVTADPHKLNSFRPFLTEPEPVYDAREVRTAAGELYPLVHQYDRVPVWNIGLRDKLNEKLRTGP